MSGQANLANATRKLFIITVVCGLLLLAIPSMADAASTVNGKVYDWSTFNLKSNVIVEVYSMPSATMTDKIVSKDGNYAFTLPAGKYLIKAKSGIPGSEDELMATENVTTVEGGSYVIDLILFPASGLDDLTPFSDNATTPTEVPETGNQMMFLVYLGGGAIFLILVIALGVLFTMKRRPAKSPEKVEMPPMTAEPVITPEPEKTESAPAKAETDVPAPAEPVQGAIQQPISVPVSVEQTLPQDCQEVLAIMEKNGGRITQLDLRKALPYSEAKVSLIVSDLENRGLVKKIKKGRGNVLILNRPGEQAPEK